uniref:Uncharacterized protein n=1 Tax=Cannabis sativa TaxID=3483 RepID=A0A803NIP3_CANSA
MSSGSQLAGDERSFKIVTYVKDHYALDDIFSGLVSPKLKANHCDAFVATFAEFFIHDKDVPKDFDIEIYRTRLAALLFAYGQRKNYKNIDSKDEKLNKSSKGAKDKK